MKKKKKLEKITIFAIECIDISCGWLGIREWIDQGMTNNGKNGKSSYFSSLPTNVASMNSRSFDLNYFLNFDFTRKHMHLIER